MSKRITRPKHMHHHIPSTRTLQHIRALHLANLKAGTK